MFQKKIIDKYLSKIEKDVLSKKYEQYRSIFASEEKQANIRESKEEQYQEGFIRDLFCSCLGYTIKPEASYNILTELKNESKSNAKKSDGAIIFDGVVKAVIELKGTDTQDLDRVAFQAFSYKNHHENCPYVIVSNFERLRVYVETQIEFVEFNLFTLSKEKFDLLFLLLSIDSIKNDIPLKLKHETLTEEKEITNSFYADYSAFKRDLFDDLCKNNEGIDKLTLFKKTQKLLDRILFILFCEDRNLLPANSTIGIISDFKKLKELGYYQSLYSVLKTFFSRIDKGFKSESDSTKDIFAYNGGLFKTDEILDSVTISDDVLMKHCQTLSDYDFQSQISVDILGRIFENSLTEIEDISTSLNEQQSNIGKRKKDGVFYTPEYITKYIVENTIGSLCEAKKRELKINDEEFSPESHAELATAKKIPKKVRNDKTDELDRRLAEYRSWLLGLKILDPACGSGAFLNAALKFLRKEHTLIDYFWSKIHPGELNFTAIDNAILENNLYGVDINEDSVEITKLSLWLSTAQKNRKLTTLAGKIKCGNSLISDKAVDGEKAFDWQKEFPEVFASTPLSNRSLSEVEGNACPSSGNACPTLGNTCPTLGNACPTLGNVCPTLGNTCPTLGNTCPTLGNACPTSGGFDVIIGNPPYVSAPNQMANAEMAKNREAMIQSGKYKTLYQKWDLYIPFIELGLRHLLKDGGLCSMIVPYPLTNQLYAEKARRMLLDEYTLKEIVDCSDTKIFADAVVQSCIFISKKEKAMREHKVNVSKIDGTKINLLVEKSRDELVQDEKTFVWNTKNEKRNTNRHENMHVLGDYCYISKGMVLNSDENSKDEKFVKADLISESQDDIHCKKYIEGKDLDRYEVKRIRYLEYGTERSPAKLSRPTFEELYTNQKLLINSLGDLKASVDLGEFYYCEQQVRMALLWKDLHDVENKSIATSIKKFSTMSREDMEKLSESVDLRYLLCIMNSKYASVLLENIRGGDYHIVPEHIRNIPIPEATEEQSKELVELADKMLSLNEQMQKKSAKFISRVQDNLKVQKISVALESFYALTFAEFVKELGKQKVKLSLKEQDEWEEYFDEYKAEISALTEQIEATDKAINAAVYALYGLSAEEIAAVEGNTNAKS